MAMIRACEAMPQVIQQIRMNCAHKRNRALTLQQFSDLVAWCDGGEPLLDWPGWRLP